MAAVAGSLDFRRKAQIAWARPTDHARDATLLQKKKFDLDKTIFRSLQGTLQRTVTKDRLAVDVFWSDAAASRIETAFSSVPPALEHDRALLQFMADECDFGMEHADGSFMDHLQFCYEYCVAHFKECSPRVMLLHSIMGVGTNYFPMEASKIPKLKSFVTPFEMAHIEAFPSILRLLLHGPLLDELEHCSDEKLRRLAGIKFYRLIGNQELFMDGASFWIHMNYQLMHLLDFLPIMNWRDNLDDNFMVPFMSLHALLSRADQLQAHVDFEMPVPAEKGFTPLTLGGALLSIAPSLLTRRLARQAIGKFSAEIGHSLSYELSWSPAPPQRDAAGAV